MNRKGKTLLLLGAAGVGLVMLGGKKKASAAASPVEFTGEGPDIELPPVGPPVVDAGDGSVATPSPLVPGAGGGITGGLAPVPPAQPLPEVVLVAPPAVIPSAVIPSVVPSAVPPGTIPVIPPSVAPAPAVVVPPIAPGLPPVTLPVPPAVVPPVPTVTPPIVPAIVEQTTVIPEDTRDMLQVLLARESTADWKRKEPILGKWQAARGLTADQKLGPGTALRIADETGLIPIIRFWPRGAIKEAGAVEDFQAALLTKADAVQGAHRAQLQTAAEREQGQSFGVRHPPPITPIISI